MISKFINKNKLSDDFSKVAKAYFVPLAEEIKVHQSGAKRPYFVGINGSQGSGKSTLSEFLKDYLSDTVGLKVVAMSLDDFYFSQIDRHMIATHTHPLFKTRGVPGTHNMILAKNVLYALNAQQPTNIPRFNKATDNPHPASEWTRIECAVDVVIFEGWCWGVQAQTSKQLEIPVNTLEAVEDKNAKWRNHSNNELSLHYQALYSLMNKWVMLKAPSFEAVYAWRLDQEQKLRAATKSGNNSAIMDEQQIQRFIQHYQRLTEHALESLPKTCDHVYELNSERAITAHKCNDFYA